jgi:glycosyltransferase involved in cell wall biosynthesis
VVVGYHAAALYLRTLTAMRSLDLLSVVAPMHNEDGTVDAFYERVRTALDGISFELIVVDDGSDDGTAAALDRLASSDPRVAVVRLSRSFGHQAALTAGLEHASGDAVAMLDGDLQDPPEVIQEMVERWRDGADVVYGVRSQRAGETRLKLTTARWFYRLFSKVAQIGLEQNSGDFRLLDRRALDALLCMRERNRFLRGMTVWVGFTQTAIQYERDARYAGETKYTPRKMFRFAVDAISSFSWMPLQAATLLGFFFSALAFLGLPLVVVARVAGIYVPGVSSVLFVVLLLGGIQLITVGVIGEYVGRIYDEVKGRPLYVVESRRNVEVVAPPEPPAMQAPTQSTP